MFEYYFRGNEPSEEENSNLQSQNEKSNIHAPAPASDLKEDLAPSPSAAKDIIKRSRSKSALHSYLKTYLSSIPRLPTQKSPLSPLSYLSDPTTLDHLGFPLWTVLSLNHIACCLGIGFFSLGSTSSLSFGHIFFHKLVWTASLREQYLAMSWEEHAALANLWASDQSFLKEVEIFGITLLYRGSWGTERPNPLGVGGKEISVCAKSRAVLWMQSRREDRRKMYPDLMLRLALEHDPGLKVEDMPSAQVGGGVDSTQAPYQRFSVKGDEEAQIATLERLEREGRRCEHFGQVIKWMHFWC